MKKSCIECGSIRGHKMSCVTGNRLAARHQGVNLDELEPVSLAEIAQLPNHEWNADARPPELFEHWWAKNGDRNWSVKHAAREAWYACAESLGVYDDHEQEPKQ